MPLPLCKVEQLDPSSVDNMPLRAVEAILAVAFFDWSFWTDRRGGTMLRPPVRREDPRWIRMNFDQRSVPVDLSKASELGIYCDWDRGGDLLRGDRVVMVGLPRFTSGAYLSELLGEMTAAGFVLVIEKMAQETRVCVRNPAHESMVLGGKCDKSVAIAISRAAAAAAIRVRPSFRFPILPELG